MDPPKSELMQQGENQVSRSTSRRVSAALIGIHKAFPDTQILHADSSWLPHLPTQLALGMQRFPSVECREAAATRNTQTINNNERAARLMTSPPPLFPPTKTSLSASHLYRICRKIWSQDVFVTSRRSIRQPCRPC